MKKITILQNISEFTGDFQQGKQRGRCLKFCMQSFSIISYNLRLNLLRKNKNAGKNHHQNDILHQNELQCHSLHKNMFNEHCSCPHFTSIFGFNTRFAFYKYHIRNDALTTKKKTLKYSNNNLLIVQCHYTAILKDSTTKKCERANNVINLNIRLPLG